MSQPPAPCPNANSSDGESTADNTRHIEAAGAALASTVRSLVRGSLASAPYGPAFDAHRSLLEALGALGQLDSSQQRAALLDAIDLLSVNGKPDFTNGWKTVAAEGARCYVDLTARDSYAPARLSKSVARLSDTVRRMPGQPSGDS